MHITSTQTGLSQKQRQLLARTDLLPVQMAFMRAYAAWLKTSR
jgi:hypothetical protein